MCHLRDCGGTLDMECCLFLQTARCGGVAAPSIAANLFILKASFRTVTCYERAKDRSFVSQKQRGIAEVTIQLRLQILVESMRLIAFSVGALAERDPEGYVQSAMNKTHLGVEDRWAFRSARLR